MTIRHKDMSVPVITAQVQHGGSELLDELKDNWLLLWESATCKTPYNRPEYFAAYVRAFEPHNKLVIVTVRMDGVLVAILPLVYAQEIWYGIRVRLLTTPGGDHYPWFDLVCKTGMDQIQIGEAILQQLNLLEGWHLIRLRGVAEGSALHKLLQGSASSGLRAHSIRGALVPYVTINRSNGDFDWFLGTRSRKFRYMLRRALGKAGASGDVSVRRFETADAGALEEFYHMEMSGWKGRAGTAIFCNPHLLQFYNETAKAAADYGYFRLYLMDCGSRAIAGMFAFQMDGKLSFPKIAYDEEYKRFAPGHLLVNAVIKECWQSGLREVDFLGGEMPWKADWTDQHRTSWSIHLYRNELKARLLERIRFGLMSVPRKMYRRMHRRNSEHEN